MNKKLIVILIVLFLVVVLTGAIFLSYFFVRNENKDGEIVVNSVALESSLDKFANCLNKSGVVMYGTETCPACIAQKEEFGASFRFINYVNCLAESKKCVDNNIQAIPTWIFSDGTKLVGHQTIEELSQASGCQIEP